jgi:hypothetical protein
MQKFLHGIATAIVSIVFGIVFFYGAIFALMQIGLSRYDNYEYYGQYPVLYVVPGLIGLILPATVMWLLPQSKS